MSATDENIEDIPLDIKGDNVEDEEDSFEDESSKSQEGEEEESSSNSFRPENVSGPRKSPASSIPDNIIKFDFSYGYSCRKYFNLAVLDPDNVVFISGNYLHFFDTKTKKIWFKRSALGGGIGHIRKNPKSAHFAVAECGNKPIILLYEWPSLEIVSVLKGGASKVYTNLDFSPNGKLLVSQSGEPDYLITVWNWKKENILLRNQSYVNDVHKVQFSPYIRGHIVTCGVSHIKFWIMAKTFTGLKLQGELGRFGRTEYSDILGVLPMPNGKVVSGCDWGNILLWDEGLISLEVFCPQMQKCHNGPIVQFHYFNGDLWTISMDGHIKIWWYDKIDQADPPDENRVISLDPSADFHITGASWYYIENRDPEDMDNNHFYGQDGNGGIWSLNLNPEAVVNPGTLLFKCHAGEVVDIACCPFNNYLISFGRDGRMFVYDYLMKQMLFYKEYPAKGSCMIWPSLRIVPTGDIILAGFDDGQVRIIHLKMKDFDISMQCIEAVKPHSLPITKMSLNDEGTVLVTAGEDSTIFIFKFYLLDDYEPHLIPIGFIPSPDIVTCITWNPTDTEILVGCIHGQMMQVQVPTEPVGYTDVSYLLKLNPKYKNFMTYKSQIKRNIKLKEIADKKAAKVQRKLKEIEKIKKENPGWEIDEETYLVDSESEEELKPLYIPEVPNRILWLKYTADNTIWLSVAGYDAGYIYEYYIDQKEDEPYKFKLIEDADDIEISSYVYDFSNKYIIFAMQDGSIRFNKLKEDFRDLSDYWVLTMHDNQNGFIPTMCFSWDENYFFSCGYDGNVFAYKYNTLDFYKKQANIYTRLNDIEPQYKDDVSYKKLSLEETKIKAESDRIQKEANEAKARVRTIIKDLKERYLNLKKSNLTLLPSQKLSEKELELDDRITEHIISEFNEKLILVGKKYAYKLAKSKAQMEKLLNYITYPLDNHPLVVTGINNPDIQIMSLRQKKLCPRFFEMMKTLQMKMDVWKIRGSMNVQPVVLDRFEEVSTPTTALEYFLLSLPPHVLTETQGTKLRKLLEKYRTRRKKWENRVAEWEKFNAEKPVPGKNHPDDELALEVAISHVGVYQFKESPNYQPPAEMAESTVKKYKELLETKLKQYNIRHDYIQKVSNIRDLKYTVRNSLLESQKKLQEIHNLLPVALCKMGPAIPEVNPSEFPEKDLEPHVILSDEEEEEVSVPSTTDVIIQKEEVKCNFNVIFTENEIFPIMENNFFKSQYTRKDIAAICGATFEELCETPENVLTPLEYNLRVTCLNKLLLAQESTISNMEEQIKNFNKLIEETKNQRTEVIVKGNFIDLHILVLNQELTILKKFEDGEQRLSDQVDHSQDEVNEFQNEMNLMIARKENIEKIIENYQLEEGRIQEKFKHATETNKFYDFLKKVFKKKFKPPKSRDSDDSSSTSSSSEDSEEDIESIDSKDFNIIKQDLNVCPKGCELAIYQLAVNLRSARHILEQKIREQNRILDVLKKEIEVANKTFNMLKSRLAKTQNELDDYMREKQINLNRVNCTVVLRLNQIYDLKLGEPDIKEYLVFSKTQFSELYKHMAVLEREEFEEKSKYDTYLTHLSRMKKDINFMRAKATHLKNTIHQLMMEKFGQRVNIRDLELLSLQMQFQKNKLNDLEEVVLKKLVYELRLKLTDFKSWYELEFKVINKKIMKGQEELLKTIRSNTAKLELLQIINKERRDLVKVILLQPKKRQYLESTEHAHSKNMKDIAKLENIIENQEKQLEELKREIKHLKMKGSPPTPLPKYTTEDAHASMPRIDLADSDWTQFDKYIIDDDEKSEEIAEAASQGYLIKSEEYVRLLLESLVENMKISRTPSEEAVRSIIDLLLTRTSIQLIIADIIRKLPSELTLDQIGTTGDEFVNEFANLTEEEVTRQYLEGIVDSIVGNIGNQSSTILTNLSKTLVESVAPDKLFEEKSIEAITGRLKATVPDIGPDNFDQESHTQIMETIPDDIREDIQAMLNSILSDLSKNEEYMSDE